MTETVTIIVKNMTCEGCASKVRGALENSGKTKSVDINISEKEVKVTGGLSENEVIDLVKSIGYSPTTKKKGWLDKIL